MANTDKISAYLASGWELKEETPETWVLTKTNTSFGWHFLIFCFFPIIGNVIYHYASKDKKTILK